MTATTTKTGRSAEPPKMTRPETQIRRARHVGRDIGGLAVNVYERGIADMVAFEKDAAKIAPYPWMRSAFTVSAGLIEDVGAAYVKTARRILQ
jgi:hypothetical protein